MRKVTAGAVVATIALAVAMVSQAAENKGVEGSPHDFSSMTQWNTRGGVCSPCHAAHNTDPDQIVPLWAHATDKTTEFTPYDSPTLQAAPGQPQGVSLACLSCHDGVLAINEGISGLSGTNGAFYVDALIGEEGDLHTTHPVSFDYTPALATLDGALENPNTYKIGDPKDSTKITINNAPVPGTGWTGISLTGKTINEALLGNNNRFECTSCHDVHKLVGSAPSSGIMSKISGTDVNGRGSLNCRTCHIK